MGKRQAKRKSQKREILSTRSRLESFFASANRTGCLFFSKDEILVANRIALSMPSAVGGASRLRATTAAAMTGKQRSAPPLLTKTSTLAVSTPLFSRPLAPRRRQAAPCLAPPLAAAPPTPPDGGRSREDIERILRSLEPSSSSSPSSALSPPSSSAPLSPRSASASASKSSDSSNNFFLGPPQGRGTFLLVLLNVAVFAVATLASQGLVGPFSRSLSPFVSSLALSHSRPRWWQLLTCSFLHLDLQHLAGNLFSLLVFGRDIELAEGAGAVWLYYLVTALFASLASLLFGPRNAVSLGASGAVFGLFAVAVAGKVSLNFRSLLECATLASFVVPRVLSEVRSQALGGTVTGAGSTVGHVAHLGGAAAGVLLVLLLSRLSPAE